MSEQCCFAGAKGSVGVRMRDWTGRLLTSLGDKERRASLRSSTVDMSRTVAAVLKQDVQEWAQPHHAGQNKAGGEICGDDLSKASFHAGASRRPSRESIAIIGCHYDSSYDGELLLDAGDLPRMTTVLSAPNFVGADPPKPNSMALTNMYAECPSRNHDTR